MKNIAAVFSSTTLILMTISAEYGFRFRHLIFNPIKLNTGPENSTGDPFVNSLIVHPLDVSIWLIRLSLILSIIFIYLAFREMPSRAKHKEKIFK